MVAVYIIGGVMILLAILLTAMILMQTGKDQGLSSAISGGGADTFFGRAGGSKKEKWLFRFTLIGSVLFVVLSIVLTILIKTGV